MCHRYTAATGSRHIDRKLFKMRELRGAGTVYVNYVPTEVNPADLFTKILGRQIFERHVRVVMNLPAGEIVEQARSKRAYEKRQAELARASK